MMFILPLLKEGKAVRATWKQVLWQRQYVGHCLETEYSRPSTQ